MDSSLNIQYGCGLSCPDGWLNFDASPRLRAERMLLLGSALDTSGKRLFPKAVRYGDIVRGLPVPKASAKAVYCSHVLEHIDRSGIILALRNTFDMLRPGGVFRLVVPDLAWRARSYLDAQANGDSVAADNFMRACYLGQETQMRGLMNRLRLALGNADHRWMYDEAAMSVLLKSAGFTDIHRTTLGTAEDPAFALVEEKGRFVDAGHDELALEARRPK